MKILRKKFYQEFVVFIKGDKTPAIVFDNVEVRESDFGYHIWRDGRYIGVLTKSKFEIKEG